LLGCRKPTGSFAFVHIDLSSFAPALLMSTTEKGLQTTGLRVTHEKRHHSIP
jgi:hypothetical protein